MYGMSPQETQELIAGNKLKKDAADREKSADSISQYLESAKTADWSQDQEDISAMQNTLRSGLNDRISGQGLEATKQGEESREAQGAGVSSYLSSMRGGYDASKARAAERMQSATPMFNANSQRQAETQEKQQWSAQLVDFDTQMRQAEITTEQALSTWEETRNAINTQILSFQGEYEALGNSTEDAKQMALLKLESLGYTEELATKKANYRHAIEAQQEAQAAFQQALGFIGAGANVVGTVGMLAGSDERIKKNVKDGGSAIERYLEGCK